MDLGLWIEEVYLIENEMRIDVLGMGGDQITVDEPFTHLRNAAATTNIWSTFAATFVGVAQVRPSEKVRWSVRRWRLKALRPYRFQLGVQCNPISITARLQHPEQRMSSVPGCQP